MSVSMDTVRNSSALDTFHCLYLLYNWLYHWSLAVIVLWKLRSMIIFLFLVMRKNHFQHTVTHSRTSTKIMFLFRN